MMAHNPASSSLLPPLVMPGDRKPRPTLTRSSSGPFMKDAVASRGALAAVWSQRLPEPEHSKAAGAVHMHLSSVKGSLEKRHPRGLSDALKNAHGVRYLQTLNSVRRCRSATHIHRHALETALATHVVRARLTLDQWQKGIHNIKLARQKRDKGALEEALRTWQFADDDPEVAKALEAIDQWKVAEDALGPAMREATQQRNIKRLKEVMQQLKTSGPGTIQGAVDARKLLQRYDARLQALKASIASGDDKAAEASIKAWDFDENDAEFLKARQQFIHRLGQLQTLRHFTEAFQSNKLENEQNLQDAVDAWSYEKDQEDYLLACEILRQHRSMDTNSADRGANARPFAELDSEPCCEGVNLASEQIDQNNAAAADAESAVVPGEESPVLQEDHGGPQATASFVAQQDSVLEMGNDAGGGGDGGVSGGGGDRGAVDENQEGKQHNETGASAQPKSGERDVEPYSFEFDAPAQSFVAKEDDEGASSAQPESGVQADQGADAYEFEPDALAPEQSFVAKEESYVFEADDEGMSAKPETGEHAGYDEFEADEPSQHHVNQTDNAYSFHFEGEDTDGKHAPEQSFVAKEESDVFEADDEGTSAKPETGEHAGYDEFEADEPSQHNEFEADEPSQHHVNQTANAYSSGFEGEDTEGDASFEMSETQEVMRPSASEKSGEANNATDPASLQTVEEVSAAESQSGNDST